MLEFEIRTQSLCAIIYITRQPISLSLSFAHLNDVWSEQVEMKKNVAASAQNAIDGT